MENVLSLLTAPSVWPYSILLGIVLLYWLTVFIGALDIELFDLELDTEANGELGFWGETLTFLNLGQVPFMIFVSLLVLLLWVGAAAAFGIWSDTPSLGFWVLLPNLIWGLIATKFATIPFKGIHRKMNQSGLSKRDLVGKIGEIVMTVEPGRQGRIEVQNERETIVLDVTCHDTALSRGQQAIILEYDPVQDQYVVTAFEV